MYPIIRLEHIELKNFKSIKYGVIDHLEYRNKLFYTGSSDILGIYGQNGSGKTAVIEAVKVLKDLMSGKPLSEEVSHMIYHGETQTILKFAFYIEDHGQTDHENVRYDVHYDVCISNEVKEHLKTKNPIYIKSESISYSKIGVRPRVELIRYECENNQTVFLPKVRVNEVTRQNPNAMIQLEVARRTSLQNSISFIFHSDVIDLFASPKVNKEYGRILSLLHYYAKMNLFVISNRNIEESGLCYIPISFRITLDDIVSSGIAPISLIGPSTVDAQSYELIRLVIGQLNLVVSSVLPQMQLSLHELERSMGVDGKAQRIIEIMSVKNHREIPLKYESEGIKKILSILSTLISVYNNPSVCLVVDELDAGIFEYLLGELLSILKRYGKGQLVFTSHNLRPLEKLPKESIIVSTTNEYNRFIRIPKEKGNSNYRNSYLRGIDLGGLNEEIYQTTNSFQISHAFRKAGEFLEEE